MIGANEFKPFPEAANSTCKSVMPLFAIREDQFIPLGTCFAITDDGILLTALHVILEAFPDVDLQQDKNQTICRYLFARYIDFERGTGSLIKIFKIYFMEKFDIAVLYGYGFFEDNTKVNFAISRLSAIPPKIGENVLGMGYHKTSFAGSHFDKKLNKLDLQYSINTAATTGKVTKIYLEGRDKIMLNFPCFEVDARFDSGMSGGPVFSEKNGIIGIITSSMHTDEPNKYISWCALVWLALGIEIEVTENDQIQKCKLKILVDTGKIPMDVSKKFISISKVEKHDVLSIDFASLKAPSSKPTPTSSTANPPSNVSWNASPSLPLNPATSPTTPTTTPTKPSKTPATPSTSSNKSSPSASKP